MEAVAKHGAISADTVTGSYGDAEELFSALRETGGDYDDVVTGLAAAGVEQFQGAWSELLDMLAKQLTARSATR